VNISKTKKDIPKRKTPFFFTLKSLSNQQHQSAYYFIGTLKDPTLSAFFILSSKTQGFHLHCGPEPNVALKSAQSFVLTLANVEKYVDELLNFPPSMANIFMSLGSS